MRGFCLEFCLIMRPLVQVYPLPEGPIESTEQVSSEGLML